METKEIRLINLLNLAKRYGQDVEFCKRIDMNPSYLPQLKARTKSIGDKVARKVEEKLNLERGYMDVVHDPKLLPDTLPAADVMSVAYTIESLPAPVRDQFKKLVFTMLAYINNQPANDEPTGNDIAPFSATIKAQPVGQSHPLPKAQAK